MKAEFICFLSFLMLIEAATVGKGKTYTTRYNHINLDDIFSNPRLMKSYYRCLVNLGPCTAEGSELKRVLPEVLQTKCRKCTPIQKKKARNAIDFVMKYYPEMWEGVKKKYDPTGELTKNILTDPNFLG